MQLHPIATPPPHAEQPTLPTEGPLSSTTRAATGPHGAAPRTRLGRYVIEGVLGAGGMAIVYLARDPVLDRQVALKVLHVEDDDHGARRLVREGQALARVGHPNVIHVYEVGREPDGIVYVAMERIVGVTLARWLATPRPLAAKLAAFEAAGRGLAAAHAAGVVHRDFKPENVMVGDDGRVCVLDFGLARAADDEPELPRRPPPRALGVDATVAGSVLGTPAFMSPEQWRGERATAASDQFSFCVALWRALAERHPFADTSRQALQSSVLAGDLTPPTRALPRALRAMLRRGLDVDPRARHASMDIVVAALAHAQRRRRWLAPAAAVAALAGAAAVTQLGAAGATRGAPSPGSARDDGPTLYGAPTPITSRGDVARAAVAPDGRRVALVTPDAVIVQPLEPGAAQRVVLRGRTSHQVLAWDPDGRQLAVIAAIGGAEPGLMLVDVAAGTARRLGPSLGAVALIGDGELASARFSGKALEIYALADLTTPRRRCPLPGAFTGIRDVAFDAAAGAIYVQLDDSDRRSTLLRLDRACRQVTVAAGPLAMLSYAVRPGQGRVLARLMESHRLVELGPDGQSELAEHVLQSGQFAPLAVQPGGAIVHVDRATRWALRELPTAPRAELAAGADAIPGALRELATGAADSRFSLTADGRVAQVDGVYERGLVRVGALDSLDGGLTTIAFGATRAVWSPDGRKLAVLLQRPSGYQLATWDAGARALSPARPLAVPYDVELTWLDERRVAYPASSARTELAWLDVTTGATGTLAPGLGRAVLSVARAHGDDRLAFVTESARALSVWTLREGAPPRLAAEIPVESPSAARIPRVTWAADDRSLIAFDGAAGELWSVSLGDGAAPAVQPLASGIEHGRGLVRISDVIARRDRLLIATVTATSDVFVSAPTGRP